MRNVGVCVCVCVLVASPYWRHGSPPSDMMVDDEAALDVECRAHGRPKPTITWSINGTNFGR